MLSLANVFLCLAISLRETYFQAGFLTFDASSDWLPCACMPSKHMTLPVLGGLPRIMPTLVLLMPLMLMLLPCL